MKERYGKKKRNERMRDAEREETKKDSCGESKRRGNIKNREK